jgi:broad specificity phosphatase PhoE
MKHLILVRHGQPDVAATQGAANPPLTARGHQQAKAAAAVLSAERIDRIVSSGMIRADDTAKPLAVALNREIETLHGLGEIDRLGGPYVSIDAIREKGAYEWRKFLAAPLAYFGIDAAHFRAETLSAFEVIVNGEASETVAVFTHGFPINILLSHALGLESEARFVPSYASITRLSGRSLDALTVISVNEAGHIPEALR